jgi:hypothetical protein
MVLRSCSSDNQKATILARNERVSLMIDHNTSEVLKMTGLPMDTRAQLAASREH